MLSLRVTKETKHFEAKVRILNRKGENERGGWMDGWMEIERKRETQKERIKN